MRVLAIAAFALVVAADHSAQAASCGKGMLWPYVRQPGDCLTGAEIQSGLRGVYNGPVDTNPNIGAIAPAAPVQEGTITSVPSPVPAQAAPVPALPVAPATAATAAPVAPVAPAAAVAGCTKSPLWPFIKKPGDCLTAVEEKKIGNPLCVYRNPGDCQRTMIAPTGVYGGGTAVAATPVSATSTVTGSAAQPSATPASASQTVVPTCTKGPLWPFVRRAGDCPTTAEQRRGR